MTIRFALVWSRLCPYYTRRGHGCARTTHAAVTVVPVLHSDLFEYFWTEITYAIHVIHGSIFSKNNHLDNKEPLCPDHKNIRLQTLPTSAINCTWNKITKVPWVRNSGLNLGQCFRFFAPPVNHFFKDCTCVIYLTYKELYNLYFTFQWIIQCAHQSIHMCNRI